jgi:hypothetical protein
LKPLSAYSLKNPVEWNDWSELKRQHGASRASGTKALRKKKAARLV